MRAAAGAIIVYGTLTIAALTTLAAFAQAVQSQAPDYVTEPELRAFYYERTAAALFVLIGAIWAAACKVAVALKGYFDGLKDEIRASTAKFETAVERLTETLVKHDSSPESHRDIRRQTDKIFAALDDLLDRKRLLAEENDGTEDETSV